VRAGTRIVQLESRVTAHDGDDEDDENGDAGAGGTLVATATGSFAVLGTADPEG